MAKSRAVALNLILLVAGAACLQLAGKLASSNSTVPMIKLMVNMYISIVMDDYNNGNDSNANILQGSFPDLAPCCFGCLCCGSLGRCFSLGQVS